jgi:NitT/TauT family transport system substrate-binding protein
VADGAKQISRRDFLAAGLGTASVVLSADTAFARDTLTAGAVQFGTVHWLLDVIKERKLDAAEGFSLSIRMLASTNAADVALLGGEADIVVADWFWVMRQRKVGGDYLFMPFSAALGSVIVPQDSPLKSIADLKGKTIGVAGGPIDKSWLLLRAYSIKEGIGDLATAARPVFGAPPLLNEQATLGRVDALLNFWPFAARLEAEGYRRLITVAEIMRTFDIGNALPLVGFVFAASLAKDEPRLLRGFANTVKKGQQILQSSNEEWDRIRPLTKARSDAEFQTLRDRYREGLLHTWNAQDRQAAGKLFSIVRQVGGEEVTGPGVQFDPKAFWDDLVF